MLIACPRQTDVGDVHTDGCCFFMLIVRIRAMSAQCMEPSSRPGCILVSNYLCIDASVQANYL